MYSPTLLLGITSLILASTAHAQAERGLLNLTPTAYGITRTSGHSATAGASGGSVLRESSWRCQRRCLRASRVRGGPVGRRLSIGIRAVPGGPRSRERDHIHA